MANGHKPPPRSPIARAISDTTKVNPVLRDRLSLGLMDTLRAIAGQEFVTDTLPDFMKGGGTIGHWPVNTDTIQVHRGLPLRLARETAMHEVGHLTSESSNRLPEARQAAKRGLHEPVAKAFTRALLALQATRQDTTNAQGIIEQFAMGIHPGMTDFEKRGRRAPGTQMLLAELLALPIFQEHPLQPRREQLLREASSIR